MTFCGCHLRNKGKATGAENRKGKIKKRKRLTFSLRFGIMY